MKAAIVKIFLLILCLGAVSVPTAGRAADRLIMPHGTHFEADVECVACHEGAAASSSSADRILPEMSVCADCHDVEDEANCSQCHTSPDEAGQWNGRAPLNARFSHSAHLAQGQECGRCHGDPAAAQPHLPAKADCRVCHVTADDYADCGVCHANPERPVPASHRNDWMTGHALDAQSNSGLCFQCHTETGCQECHGGDNVRPRSHGLNFVFGHAVVARGSEMECATCHSEPEYCSSCHLAERVMPRSHSSGGWVNSADGGRHALDAPFEMENCIVCHDNGGDSPSCTTCHGG